MSYYNQQQTVNPQNIAQAEQELEMVTDLFNKIVSSCHSKCLANQEQDKHELISKKATECIENCVAKFFETNTRVGELMQKKE
ncbi:mitochondrial import inner membrane translocase subunit tim10 [Pilobolus umbonatus]|nr:mitochondrial import inner membrane translocase subunit tim10 [Pilobolus umbonatus]